MKKNGCQMKMKQENAVLGGTVVLSIVIALALFFRIAVFPFRVF